MPFGREEGKRATPLARGQVCPSGGKRAYRTRAGIPLPGAGTPCPGAGPPEPAGATKSGAIGSPFDGGPPFFITSWEDSASGIDVRAPRSKDDLGGPRVTWQPTCLPFSPSGRFSSSLVPQDPGLAVIIDEIMDGAQVPWHITVTFPFANGTALFAGCTTGNYVEIPCLPPDLLCAITSACWTPKKRFLVPSPIRGPGLSPLGLFPWLYATEPSFPSVAAPIGGFDENKFPASSHKIVGAPDCDFPCTLHHKRGNIIAFLVGKHDFPQDGRDPSFQSPGSGIVLPYARWFEATHLV